MFIFYERFLALQSDFLIPNTEEMKKKNWTEKVINTQTPAMLLSVICHLLPILPTEVCLKHEPLFILQGCFAQSDQYALSFLDLSLSLQSRESKEIKLSGTLLPFPTCHDKRRWKDRWKSLNVSASLTEMIKSAIRCRWNCKLCTLIRTEAEKRSLILFGTPKSQPLPQWLLPPLPFLEIIFLLFHTTTPFRSLPFLPGPGF